MTDFSELRSLVTVLEPGDEGFAAAVTGANLFFRDSPEAVVLATSVDDVVTAVRFAVASNLPVRVFATGHGAHESVHDGLLIVVAELDRVSVDPEARIATFGGGARWQSIVDAAAAHGLAPVAGSAATVGAVGYLLGGGLGPLARSHGYSSDWVRGFSIVLASGDIVEASADENPELFWALRGGKGGFGVVVEVRLELVPLAQLFGGNIMFDTPAIEPVLRAWVDFTATAPADVTSSVAIMRFPPIEAVPVFLRGKTLFNLRFAYPGDAVRGEEILTPLREVAPPMLDTVAEMPVSALATIHNDPTDPVPGITRGTMLSALDQDFVTALLAVAGAEQHIPTVAIEIRHLGSATRVDVAGGSAVGGRSSDFTLNLVSIVAQPGMDVAIAAANDAIITAISAWVAPETTINFAPHPHSLEEFASSWPRETFDRLVTARKSVDPTGVFLYGFID